MVTTPDDDPGPDEPGLLEQRAPGLTGTRRRIGRWPTPVRPLDVGGGEPLWCKDEGRNAPGYGGNKVRKLEWVLPRVPPGAALVTAGAVGSNHVLATALNAAATGMRVHAILVPQPDTPSARRNAAVSAALLHRVWPVRSEALASPTLARAVAAAWRADRVRPRVVWIGGSTRRGVLGWVEGGLEIADQVACGELPAPVRVYVPAGSGGTSAGLLVGLRMGGLETVVHAVRVADRVWANRRMILGLARAGAREITRAGGAVPPLDPTRLVVDHDWFGRGYGAPSPAGEQAAEQAHGLGLGIEPTYSAKTFAAALAALRAGVDGPLLWIDTANAHPIDALAGGTLPDLPADIERLLI